MEQFVRQFVHTHEQVYNFYGETSKQTLTLAVNYTLANKPFSGMTLQKKKVELEELLTKGMNKTHSFRGNFLDENFAAQFLIGNQVTMELREFSNHVRKLIDVGFPKKSTTLPAALYLTSNEGHAERAHQLYQEMKKYHPFLTGAGDIPITVFITQNPDLKGANVAKLMNDYYNELKGTFKQGKALHQLSQLLVLWSPTYIEHLVPYIKQLKLKLEKRKVRVNKKLYSLIGILALNGSDDHIINVVIHVYTDLINTKLLKFNKEIALQTAIKKTIQQRANETKVISNEGGLKLSELVDFLTHAMEVPLEIGEFILDHILLD